MSARLYMQSNVNPLVRMCFRPTARMGRDHYRDYAFDAGYQFSATAPTS